MAQDFQNPSFETPGEEAGQALDWTMTIVNSLREFATFDRGDAIAVISVFDAVIPAGVTIIDNEDGTLQLINALGEKEAVEAFGFGWQSNQFFLFAFPESFLSEVKFSQAKSQEDFEDGFGEDDNFVVAEGATTTVIPVVEELVTNAYQGAKIDINGETREVLSNTTTAFTVAALTTAPIADASIRVVQGPVNDEGFLDSFTGLDAGDGLTESFNGGWPGGAPSTFKDAFDSITFGSLDANVFTDGAGLPAGDFANDIRFVVFTMNNASGSPSSLTISYLNTFGNPVGSFPVNFNVPPGTTIPPEGVEVPISAFNFDGLRDLTGMAEGFTPFNKFTMIGGPGADLERASF
jgi:hypothetical protein